MGLALWAAYPANNNGLADRKLPVFSIYGTNDGLASRFEVDASRALLPASTRYVPIEGGNHAQMGDYTGQPDDPPAAISRDAQQEQVQQATIGTEVDGEVAARLRAARQEVAGRGRLERFWRVGDLTLQEPGLAGVAHAGPARPANGHVAGLGELEDAGVRVVPADVQVRSSRRTRAGRCPGCLRAGVAAGRCSATMPGVIGASAPNASVCTWAVGTPRACQPVTDRTP